MEGENIGVCVYIVVAEEPVVPCEIFAGTLQQVLAEQSTETWRMSRIVQPFRDIEVALSSGSEHWWVTALRLLLRVFNERYVGYNVEKNRSKNIIDLPVFNRGTLPPGYRDVFPASSQWPTGSVIAKADGKWVSLLLHTLAFVRKITSTSCKTQDLDQLTRSVALDVDSSALNLRSRYLYKFHFYKFLMFNESTKTLFPCDDKKVDTTWFVVTLPLPYTRQNFANSFSQILLTLSKHFNMDLHTQLPPCGEIRKSVLSTVFINFLWYNVGTTGPRADVRCIRKL
ncbi:hypothetical protein V1478_015703 [Vespula squamosa]|uniref:Uncharacterized protein n=1 Tax=Vespula squamosa TaxID=30214 RepID=A0ABD2A1N7_VESSQ